MSFTSLRALLVGTLLTALMAAAFVACAEQKDREPAAVVTPYGTCNLSFKRLGDCARVVWENAPSEDEDGSFYLEFYKESDPGLLISPRADVVVTYGLANQGEPANSGVVTQTNEGQYRVERVSMRRPGAWVIRVQLTNGTVVSDQDQMSYSRL